jgi:transcriptional regulator with XRE-family HTH domain
MELGRLMGERIRRARERKGWNQSELARRVHKSRQHLSQLEQGRQQPRGELLIALARVLGVTTDYLYGLSDDLEREPELARIGA